MYFGYNLSSKLGDVPCFTDDENVPQLPLGTTIAVANPSDDSQQTMRTFHIYPITGSGIMTSEGEKDVSEFESFYNTVIGYASNGSPAILHRPITKSQIPRGIKTQSITVDIPGHSPIFLVNVIILIAVLMLLCVLANQIFVKPLEEQRKIEEQRNSMLEWAATEKEVVELDINDDGIADIRTVAYNNGDIVSYALTDEGYVAKGNQNIVIDREGSSGLDLLNALVTENIWQGLGATLGQVVWILAVLAIIAVIALIAFKVVLPSILHAKSQTALPPAT